MHGAYDFYFNAQFLLLYFPDSLRVVLTLRVSM